jgi:signal transduction histidine kinase
MAGNRALGSRLSGWWRRRGLRARLTITATAGLAVALAGGAALGTRALADSLVTGLDGTARQGAKGVAALADAGRLPNPVPVAGGTVTVQVLAGGRIVAASPGADRLVPLLSGRGLDIAARSGHAISLEGGPYGLPGLLRVVAVPASDGKIVIAAVSFTQVSGSIRMLWRAALIGTPVLIAFLAGVNWLVIGGALRPIAELRKGAQEISGAVGTRRLPVPQTRDEVHSLAVTLNDMLSRLESAEDRQRAFVSDTAHELRSPLASIRAQLEVAVDHPDSQDWHETARDVLADTLRLARLAEDLLVLARLDERGVGRAGGPIVTRTTDLASLARDAAARYDGARVPVTVRRGGPVITCCDPDGMTRVLFNLIDNAVRYADSGVAVEAWRDGSQALLAVTDDGPGIPPEDTERVFGRFTRLDDARGRGEGTESGAGLGLAIVRATVRAHGGAVWLQNAGPGLRAVVSLPTAAPVSQDAALPADGPASTAPASPAGHHAGRGATRGSDKQPDAATQAPGGSDPKIDGA